MKILGWLLIILGSNGLTGALVARRSIRYDVDILMDGISDGIIERVTEVLGRERIADLLGGESGLLGALIMPLVDNLVDTLVPNLVESLVEVLGGIIVVDETFIQRVDLLFYIAIGVLALGIAVLITGYVRGAKAKTQPQLISAQPMQAQPAGHPVYPTAGEQAICPNCYTRVSPQDQFCQACGQGVR